MTSPAPSIISVNAVSKTYASGLRALEEVNLDVRQGEIFALLGPNGAGKTTLIGMICGIVKLARGRITTRIREDLARITPPPQAAVAE